MAVKSHNSIFKKDEIKNVYIFYGEEEYLKRFYFNTLKKRVLNKGPHDFNYYSFEYKDLVLSDLIEAIENLPVMSDRKMIVINDLDFSKLRADIKDFFEKNIDTLPDYVVLVIYENIVNPDGRSSEFNKFIKLLDSKGIAVNFKKASEKDLISWVYKHIKHEGHDIDNDTIKYFLSVVDNNMSNLSNEITKLCNYASSEKIEKRHIDAICSKTIDAMAFDLTNNLVAGDDEKAFETLNKLYQLRYDVMEITGPIYWGFVTMYKVKAGMLNALSQSQIAKSSKLSDYNVRKYARICESVSIGKIRKIIQKCAQYDLEIKSKARDKQLHLEVMLGEIANIRNGISHD